MKKVRIFQDPSAGNPRVDWDNLFTMSTKHDRYQLGEDKIEGDPIEWLEDKLELENKGEYTNKRLEELEELFFAKFIAKPLYLYDHSGLTIKTSPFGCRFDSGKVGYIYLDRDEAAKQGWSEDWLNGRTIEEAAKDILEGEVENFDQYLRGDVYGFRVYETKVCEHCGHEEVEEIDACWGFYGDDWNTNGIKDHIPEELHGQLKDIEVEYL